MSADAKSEAQGERYLGRMKGLAGSNESLRCQWKVPVQLHERTSAGREFQILGDVTQKLREPNAVRMNRTVSRLVLNDPRE